MSLSTTTELDAGQDLDLGSDLYDDGSGSDVASQSSEGSNDFDIDIEV